MEEKTARKAIERLTKKINKYNKAFFQEGKSLVSDYEYDQLVEELVVREKSFPQYRTASSPTQRIGETTSKNFQSRPHTYPMYSLGNTYEEEEIKQFIKRAEKILATQHIDFVCELKIDGLALSVVYKDGQLKHVLTRGDGKYGDDITLNQVLIKNLPQRITVPPHLPKSFEVRGEAFMRKEDFNRLNERHALEGKPALSNPRNAAAGILRQKQIDISLIKHPPITFCPYSLLGKDINDVTQQYQALNLLSKCGFTVFSHYQHCPTAQDVMAYIHHWQKEKKRLPMMIDGIVIKINDLKQQETLGQTAKSPRWAVAYKYKPDSASTILKDVVYQVGRTGVITPVAILKPVKLAGTVVKRASLYNAQEIVRLGLKIGDTVAIEKGGDIIPKVTRVCAKKNRGTTSSVVTFIQHCPACNTPLQKINSAIQYYCPNTAGCSPQRKGSIIHFLQKKAMNITSIGAKTVDLLFEKQLIERPVDLFYLRTEDIQPLEGFKEKAIANLLQGIEASKKAPFERILFGLGIRYVGFTVAQKLADHFHDIDHLIKASKEDLIQVPEIGEKIADSVIDYFSSAEALRQIEEMRHVGLCFKKSVVGSFEQPLAGKTFVVSGTLKKYGREEIQTYIRQHGGRPVSAVSSKVDFLVVGEKASTQKINRANELGIALISEKELGEMIVSRRKGDLNAN